MGKQDPNSPDRLVIDGLDCQLPGKHPHRRYLKFRTFLGKGRLIREIWLSPTGFRLLAILGIHRRADEADGWVGRPQLLGVREEGIITIPERVSCLRVAQLIYKVRSELNQAAREFAGWNPVECEKGAAKYRLSLKPEAVIINPEGLRNFGDRSLTDLLDRLPISSEYPSPKIVTYLIQGGSRRELLTSRASSPGI